MNKRPRVAGWLVAACCLSGGTQDAESGGAKEAIIAAARKLSEQESYTWRFDAASSDERPESADSPVPKVKMILSVEGRIGKKNIFVLKTPDGGNYKGVTALMKDGKIVLETPDGWKSQKEIEQESGGFEASFFRALPEYLRPTQEIEGLLEAISELRKDSNGDYAGKLSEGASRTLIERTIRGGGRGTLPAIGKPRGTIRVWLKDGVLSKYVAEVTGEAKVRSPAGESDVKLKRSISISISNINSTEVLIPPEAARKLE